MKNSWGKALAGVGLVAFGLSLTALFITSAVFTAGLSSIPIIVVASTCIAGGLGYSLFVTGKSASFTYGKFSGSLFRNMKEVLEKTQDKSLEKSGKRFVNKYY